MTTTTATERRTAFRALHQAGIFVLPNPYDAGSACLLTTLGFKALATTSSGFAATLGRLDGRVTRSELVAHVETLTAASDLPLNVDAEACYPNDPGGVAETVRLLAEAGAAGVSIEDWNPATPAIEPIGLATERVATAAAMAKQHGVLLTGRCENHIRGVSDLDDTITRLLAYRDAGAECLYAPGLSDLATIEKVTSAVGMAVNVLLLPTGPTVQQLGDAGVRRVSTGGLLSNVAFGSMVAAAKNLLDHGQLPEAVTLLQRDFARQAFNVTNNAPVHREN
jgi:2-methylisocitrate lyase-like PEP mutase family enzyme